ncbi:MAG: hypothetical protein WD605_02425, partial [Candidatus Paceibacterota bacterium]
GAYGAAFTIPEVGMGIGHSRGYFGIHCIPKYLAPLTFTRRDPRFKFLQNLYTFWLFCSQKLQNTSKGLAWLQVFATHPTK